MAGMKLSMVIFMVMMVATMQMQSSMAQTRHVVGDALGWTIPPNGAAAYTTWASQQNFTVGDTLYFNFSTGLHNVAEVSQAAYGPCTTTNPISITTTGPATLTLAAPGTHYYLCTVGTHCQIGQKLSINVAAAAAAPTTPPPASTPTISPPPATPTPTPTVTPTPAPVSPPTSSPTPAPGPSTTTSPPPTSSPAPSPIGASPPTPPTSGPSPSGSTTPSPAGDTTPTPPSPSNAASLIAAVPVTFLAVALAFLY